MQIRINEILKEKGITISQLADRAGIARANVSNIVHLKTAPALDTLERLANALNLPVSDLLASSDVQGFIKYRGQVYEVNDFITLSSLTSKIKAENSL